MATSVRTVFRLAAVCAVLMLPGATSSAATSSAATSSAASPSQTCTGAATSVGLTQVVEQAELQCRNLTGLDLAGKSLGQITLSGADAAGVSFAGSDLTQAELTGTDLQGADLRHADLTQATLTHANLRGADLTDANLTQADLSHADLTGATLDGTDITQATTTGTNFSDVKGLTPWSLYVLIAALLVFVVLAGMSLLQLRPRSRPTAFGRAVAVDSARAPLTGVLVGLVSSLVIAVGVHMFLGGMVSQFSFAFDTLATVCNQPECAAGINLGLIGIFGGIAVVVAGGVLRARAR